MRILQVIPFFVPAWGFGGPVKISFDLARKLVLKGHQITVATTDAYDYTKRVDNLKEVIEGVKIIRFRNVSNYLAKGYNLYLPLGFAHWIKKNIKNYDLVHLHAFFTYQNIIAACYCQKKTNPYVLHLHESLVPQPLLGKVGFKKIFNRLFGQKILAGAARILVVSQKEKEELIRYLPQLDHKIKIIPNCIDTTKSVILVQANRAKYGLDESDKVIMTLSRLSYIKRVDLLIRAFGKLVIKDPAYKLLIAGPDEGGNLVKLESLVKKLNLQNHVFFRGLVEGQKKQELWAVADIFALFSQYESFSLASLEALQHNLPVCLPKEVGVASEVLRFNCGVLITEPENARQSASQLEWVYNNRKSLARNCRAALKQFDINNVMDKLTSIYKEMA